MHRAVTPSMIKGKDPSNASARQRRNWVWRLTALLALSAVAIALLIFMGSVLLGAARTLASVSRTLEAVRPWLHAVQLAALLLIWWQWDRLVEALCRHHILPARARTPLRLARHRILLVLLAIQLLVVMNLPFSVGMRGTP